MIKYLIIILGIIIWAWCPWLEADVAIDMIDKRVAEMQKKNPNLCEITVHKNTIRKVPFGYTEKVSYDCTAIDDVFGIEKSSNVVFITFYKGILGMPNKSIKKL